MSLAVQLILAYLLSHASPVKEEARQYIKDHLSGWKEKLALAAFDAAWEVAVGLAGQRVGSLVDSKELVSTLAHAAVEADKASVTA